GHARPVQKGSSHTRLCRPGRCRQAARFVGTSCLLLRISKPSSAWTRQRSHGLPEMYACFRHSATGPECGLRSSSVNFGAGELNHRGPFLCICSDERGEAGGRALSLPRIQCVTPLLGKRTVNTEPLPSSLVTVTSPPIMRASLRVMERPSPVPPKR